MKRLAMTGILAMILLMLCGCHKSPSVVIDPVEDIPTVTTVPTEQDIPERNMRFTDMMMLNSPTMKWSWLESYCHELTSDTTAEFPVNLNETSDVTATLYVTFDAQNDTVSVAEAVFEDVTVSMLSDDDLDLYPLMYKMAEAKSE